MLGTLSSHIGPFRLQCCLWPRNNEPEAPGAEAAGSLPSSTPGQSAEQGPLGAASGSAEDAEQRFPCWLSACTFHREGLDQRWPVLTFSMTLFILFCFLFDSVTSGFFFFFFVTITWQGLLIDVMGGESPDTAGFSPGPKAPFKTELHGNLLDYLWRNPLLHSCWSRPCLACGSEKSYNGTLWQCITIRD